LIALFPRPLYCASGVVCFIESIKEVSMKKVLSLFVVSVFLFSLGGCVSSSKFEKKTAEADALGKELKTLQQQYSKLTNENNALKGQHEKLTGDFAQLSVQKDNVTADRP
jgi:outer membrane murein-binding lipoprotein Lpp